MESFYVRVTKPTTTTATTVTGTAATISTIAASTITYAAATTHTKSVAAVAAANAAKRTSVTESVIANDTFKVNGINDATTTTNTTTTATVTDTFAIPTMDRIKIDCDNNEDSTTVVRIGQLTNNEGFEVQRLFHLPSSIRLSHVIDMDGFFVERQQQQQQQPQQQEEENNHQQPCVYESGKAQTREIERGGGRGGEIGGKVFLCRELACVEIATNRLFRAVFRLDRSYASLSLKDRSSVDYVTKRVHGMSFDDRAIPPEDECLLVSQTAVCDTVKLILKNYKGENLAVGYKGGNVEYDLLRKIGVPCFNIEEIGCPKFDDLMPCIVANEREAFGVSSNCRLHDSFFRRCTRRNKFKLSYNDDECPSAASSSDGVAIHCPVTEVRCFRYWYLRYHLRL